ncbi:MAG: ABC transporter permease [Clostridia bacterium]|nr:ABC transporter permease [Clostridia bacterium]
MKQFGTILKFELKNYFTNKVFVGITVFLVAVIAVVMFFPRVIEVVDSSDAEDVSASENLPTMLILSDTDENSEAVRAAFSSAFADYDVKIADTDIEGVKEQIASGEAECAFVMSSLTSYTYYVNNLSMYDMNTAAADEVLQSIYRMSAMIQGGISAEDASAILGAQIEHETQNLGKDQMQNFFYTYIMIFALYMVILLYGQMVATNVATEKSSRAMEVLITSAKPTSMMFGKVLASCLAGLIQLVAVFGSALVCFNLNKAYWGDAGVMASIFDMPIDLFVYMLIFFVLGFFIYAFMFGAVGSTASKLEDINTSVMPITMLFIVGFFIVMFSMTGGNVDTALMKVCSYIPFTSPMAMFTRIAMTSVPFYEIAISIAILIASVIGVGVISAKIYRVGVLLYGTTPKVADIIKAVRKA